VNTQQKPFASMGYEPVGPVVNKLLARYLRTQRKNMRRFFAERGLHDLADRMNQIRKSRQGMLAKNRYFQQVLNEYARLTTPPVVTPHVLGVPEAASQPSPIVIADETEDQ
jgi:hypothetical protein